MQAESLRQCSLIISDTTENTPLSESAFLNSATSHLVVIRHVLSCLTHCLYAAQVGLIPCTFVRKPKLTLEAVGGYIRKKIGLHPSCRRVCRAPGESLRSVSLQIMAAQQSRCASPQSCLCLPPFRSQMPPLPTLLLTSAAVFLFTLPTF